MTISLVIILNLVLLITVLTGIRRSLVWSIATQGRDITSAQRPEFAVIRDPSIHQLDTARRWFGQRMVSVSRMGMERHAAARNVDRALVVEQSRQFAAANRGGET